MKILATVARFDAFLVADVLHNRLVGHISARRDEVAASPQVAAPILFLQVFELHHQLSRGLALDVLHDLAR